MFKRFKKKLQFYKLIVIEIIETLVTICLYLERDAVTNRRSDFVTWFILHENTLKAYAGVLKLEVEKDGSKQ